MADVAVQELEILDRDVARGCAALARWRRGLADDPAARAQEAPLEPVRHVAGKSTWEALGALVPSATDRDLREGLRRWVYALLQARLGLESEGAAASAATQKTARYEGEAPRLVSWREAWRGVVEAGTAADAERWLAAAADAGPALAAIQVRRAQTAVEAARRLGLGHPWEPLAPAPVAELVAAAMALLDETEDLARDTRRRYAPDARPASVMHASVARGAAEGWPARLTPRWLHDTFGEAERGLRVEVPALPRVLGAASFARTLYAHGCAVVAASIPSRTPFCVAHEPWDLRVHRAGHVFASLAADPELYLRALRVGQRAAAAQARELAWVCLLDARLSAARLVLAADAIAGRADRFEELGARLYGAPLDSRFGGAWPPVRDDEPARFAGLARAGVERDALRERFDADWFRNPRAYVHLRAVHAGPARETLDRAALREGVSALARSFEGALA